MGGVGGHAGRSAETWPTMGLAARLVCAGEAPGSVHGRAAACTDWMEQVFSPKGWPVACCTGPVVCYIETQASNPID